MPRRAGLVGLEPVREETVIQTARIVGENSAAAKALANAKERRGRGETVAFAKQGSTLLVVNVSE